MILDGGIGRPAEPVSEPENSSLEPAAPARLPARAWYDVTWNPTAGCSPVGPGCEHCEALRTVAQLARIGGKAGTRYCGLTTTGRTGAQWTGAVRLREDVLTWPLEQRKGRRILVGSLADLFHERLAYEAIDAVHAVMAVADWHGFLLQTRRAERMRAYYADPATPRRIAAAVERLLAPVVPPESRAGSTVSKGSGARRNRGTGLGRWVRPQPGSVGDTTGAASLAVWPLPNLWLGVSVEDQGSIGRIGDLLHTPASLRWVCFEPLLGPVRADLVPLAGGGFVDGLSGACFSLDGRGRRLAVNGSAPLPRLNWVLAGGETGAAARPTDPAWLRDLRDRTRAAGVPFFFKEWGEWVPTAADAADQRMVRRGRRAAGRLLDGCSWEEMPRPVRERPVRAR